MFSNTDRSQLERSHRDPAGTFEHPEMSNARVRPTRLKRPYPVAPYVRTVIDRMVANSFGIDPLLLSQSSRGRANIAHARQVAMYLAHAACEMTLTEVGELYERDRTTVAYACQIIEERRDIESFDVAIEHMASAVAIMLRAYQGPGPVHSAWRSV